MRLLLHLTLDSVGGTLYNLIKRNSPGFYTYADSPLCQLIGLHMPNLINIISTLNGKGISGYIKMNLYNHSNSNNDILTLLQVWTL